MFDKNRFAVLFAIFLVSCAVAAWEDTGVPARPAPAGSRTAPAGSRTAPAGRRPAPAAPANRRPAPAAARQPAPPPVRRTMPAPAPAPVAPTPGFVPPDLYSPFLDPQIEPRRWLSVMYVPGAEAERSLEELSVAEVEVSLGLARWRNVLSGDLDVDLRLKSIFFADDAGFAILPTALIELPLEIEWTWRFLSGGSLQLGMRPGTYAAVDALGDGLSIPFKGAFYYAVTPSFSWLLGVEIRPGWDLIAMPLVGVAWEPADFFRLTLAAPQSTALIQLGPVGLYGTAAWRNTSYGMSGDDGEPDQLTIEDLLLGAGLQIAFSDSFHLGLEGGLLINRTLLAEDDTAADKIDIDDSPYFRITFGGAF